MSLKPLPPAPPTSLPEPPAFPRDSRYRRPKGYFSGWGLFIGLLIGVAGGLFYAWNLAPVVETDTVPRQLRASAREAYAVAIALGYSFDSDLGQAVSRLAALFPDRDPIQAAADVACDLARSGYVDSSSGLRAVRSLRTFYQLQGRSGCADTLIPAAAVALEVTIVVPTATPTLPPPPSKTPTPFVQASATPAGVVIVPTTRPRRAYEGRIVNTFCDAELAGVIEIFVQTFNNQGIPGEPIRVRWEGGDSTFFSGLKPERGSGYADFTMQAGLGYTIEMPGLSDPVGVGRPLVADSCFTPDGTQSITSFRVVFNPAE
ncbi:MAG: hypothetical protein MUE40_15020 [Anaerolineae bacterium]|nr:hypothetical protein [Anaerolineae bacterium]